MAILFIIGLLLIFSSFIFLFNDMDVLAYVFVAIGCYVISVPIWEFDKHDPSAIEVYQGKTTLLKTYKDGVVVDSVVVYKDKK